MKLAVIIFLSACSTPKADERQSLADSASFTYEYGFDANTFESYLRLDNYLTDTKVEKDAIQFIDSSSAILVNPTGQQLSEMTEDYGEDGLNTILDDQGYFQSNARHILDSAAILIIEAEKRFIRFTGEKNKSWLLDIRRDGAPAWNVILFNIRKEPEIIPATDLTRHKVAQFFDLEGK